MPTDEAAEPHDHRFARGLRLLIALLALLFLPAAIYGLYVVDQIARIREHNLRSLDNAAQAVDSLLENTRTTVVNMGSPRYACEFFRRQTRLALVPRCEVLEGLVETISSDESELDTSHGRLEIVVPIRLRNGGETQPEGRRLCRPADGKNGSPAAASTSPGGAAREASPKCALRAEILLSTLLEEIPFGAALDQLLIVDEEGVLLGSAVRPHRGSPMLPPRLNVSDTAPPVHALNLADLMRAGEREADKFKESSHATLVRAVELGGTRYTLMCQPWRIALGSERTEVATWRLCGLTHERRTFQQALEVAPYVVTVLVALLTFAIVGWPILKVLSLAPSERIRFTDLYLLMLGTLTLTMLSAVAVAHIGTYAQLREASGVRLRTLAEQIESSMRAELARMYEQLREYDEALSIWRGAIPRESKDALRAGCLLLGDEPAAHCQRPKQTLPLRKPGKYEHFSSVFWMRPCDGEQIVKADVRPWSTPPVSLAQREYFRAVRRNRLWRMADTPGSTAGSTLDSFFVETSSSITTGEFFAALSVPSRVKLPQTAASGDREQAETDCNDSEKDRVAAALTGRMVSMTYPVLAPGVGFAIVDRDGRVLFHSDERHAARENLLNDQGLARRVRAVLAAGAQAEFFAQYETRLHQVYVRPMRDVPWFVMTFADDEVLHTLHLELLGQAGVLIFSYLVIAFLGTLLYMLLRGRSPPVLMWPRPEPRFRPLYSETVCSLATQLVLFLLAAHILSGVALLIAAFVLPVFALVTLGLAASAARESGERLSEDNRRKITRGQRWIAAAPVLATALLAVGVALMSQHDPLSAAHIRTGAQTWVLGILLVVGIGATALAMDAARRKLGQSREDGNSREPSRWTRWWRDPIGPHVIATVATWLMLGAMPAYALYKLSLVSRMIVFTQAEQTYLARAFAWRGCQIQDDFQRIPTPRVGPHDDIVLRRIRIAPANERPTAPVAMSDGAQIEHEQAPAYSDIYTGALLARRVDVQWSMPHAAGGDFRSRPTLGPFSWDIANLAPIYNETTTYSRYLETTPAQHASSHWSWRFEQGAAPLLVYTYGQESFCDRFVPVIRGGLPMTAPGVSAFGLMFAGGFLALLFAWVSFGARKLFFGDIEEEARYTTRSDGKASDHLLQGLRERPELPWALLEVAPIGMHFSTERLEEWCRTCTTLRGVAERILEQARPVYEHAWKSCSDEEKLLLIQLVEEGFANPKQGEVVRKLLEKGLLRLDPALRPMNQSFALFVEGSAQPEQTREQERAHRGLRWSLVRSLLLAALLLILLFLSITQREVVEVWIKYLGAAAAAVVAILKSFSFLSRPSALKPD